MEGEKRKDIDTDRRRENEKGFIRIEKGEKKYMTLTDGGKMKWV